MKALTAFAFASFLTLSCLSSDASGWSWKDLKIGSTTEEELLKYGGPPSEVKFWYHDYVRLKEGKPYRVHFRYVDNRLSRGLDDLKIDGEVIIYDSLNIPILRTAPLQLSEEIEEIEFEALFVQKKLFSYKYTFSIKASTNRTDADLAKYVEIFNTLLGRPISMRNIHYIEYEGCYRLEIEPRIPYRERIHLRCGADKRLK